MTIKERLEVAEGVDHMDILGTSTPGRRNSEGKGRNLPGIFKKPQGPKAAGVNRLST